MFRLNGRVGLEKPAGGPEQAARELGQLRWRN